MPSTLNAKLPPNPYRRAPIKERADLAGRARELKLIRYYLGLTAAGQSPHLALIGQRGIGKTSLLNGAASIAKELKLLPVRLDMNEHKANSQWHFWTDLYQTLALAMVKVGCWDGVQGTIYAELFKMLYARQQGSLDKAVMQVPYVISCYQGDFNDFECPDALVINDFESCLTELKSKGYTGIALLIDEADCLGKNVPLLQMFRNIFQVVDHCSLLLAGTDAVFPALSEVFSPIPRQFHRIDIKPFARWFDTMALVLGPVSKGVPEEITPDEDAIEDLHELCGGAPDEVQLYCHHMYRSVEDGSTKKMSLSPKVFREVLREYRSNSSANVDATLNAIERLPDKYLFQSNWVSLRKLTLEENIKFSILKRELESDKSLTIDERAGVTAELTDGYRLLFEEGITESLNCLQLAGTPLSAGFWKSFVVVERDKRWTWSDTSFIDNIHQAICKAITKTCEASGGHINFNNCCGCVALSALQDLRNGQIPKEFDDGMSEMITSALFARDLKFTHVADVTFKISSPAGKKVHQSRFFEKGMSPLIEEQFQEWINIHRDILAGNEVHIELEGFVRWELPNSEELHRLARITGYRLPDVFGPSPGDEAITKFRAGDIAGCATAFENMLKDKEEDQIRNNLAFCQMLMNMIPQAFENVAKAINQDYEPLYELNKGLCEFLQGDKNTAKQSLENAFDQLRSPDTKFDPVLALFVLVLDNSSTTVNFYKDIPIDAAIKLNLWRMGHLPRIDLESSLNKLYPEKALEWLSKFPDLISGE